MKLLTALFIITIFLFHHSTLAQSATIKGIVKDATSGELLIGATIQLDEQGTVTDVDGNFEIVVAAGRYQLSISYIGYSTFVKTINLKANENNIQNVALEPSTTLLNTATITSGKFEQRLAEATVSLEVLKPDLLESNNTVSVSSILGKVSGVSIIDGQANIRGGSGYSYGAGSRVLLLMDDIPILTADAGFPNWRDIPVENIAQIEVVKGASSALYGSSALNGIINIRTGYAKSQPETKFSTFFKTFNKPKNDLAWWEDGLANAPYETGASINHKQKFGKLDVVAGGFYSYSSGIIQDEREGVEQKGNFRRYGRFNANLRYRFNDRLNIGFNTNINRGSSKDFFYWKGENDLFTGDTTTLSEGTQNRINIDPFVSYFDNSGNRHKLLGRIYRVNNAFNNDQSNGSNLYYGEYQFQRKFEPISLVITAGLVGMSASSSSALYGGNEYTSQNVAVYLQAEKKFFDKLNVSTGFRWEHNSIYNDAFLEAFTDKEVPEQTKTESKPVFRIGTNYQAAEYTFLRASWGQGYRFPTIAEKFISTNVAAGIQAVPNPDLESETGWSTELGIKQGFRISEFEGFVDVAAFWSEYQNMMEFSLIFQPPFSLGFQSQNVGNTRIRGIDFSIAGRGELFGLPTTLLAGYVYIDPKFKEFDATGKGLTVNRLADAPTAQLNAWNSSVDYNILKYRFRHSATFDMESKIRKLSIGLAANYNSHMEAIDFLLESREDIVPGAKAFREENNNGYFLLGVRAGYYFTPKIKLSTVINNLLNETYSVRVGVMNAPRNIALRLDMTF